MKSWCVLQTAKHCPPVRTAVLPVACSLLQAVRALLLPVPARESDLTTQLPPEGPG